MFTQRKAEIITAALLSIVLSVALIVVGLQMTVHLFEQKKADNSLLLDNFADTVKDLSASQANENFSYFVRLTDEDLFMFFSAGREPIYLVHEEIPQHYYVFERPDVDECKDRACICLCKDGPFWGNDLTETKATGLTQKNIFENIGQPSSASNGGLPCMQVTCVGDPIPKETIFGNSRGERRDFVYFQEIHDAVDKSNKDGRQIYYPIPLDILILINDDDAKQHDIFFSTVVGKNYNYEEQESSYVNLLIRDYAWDGGVIIGGMGYADEKHAKKKELIPPKVVFRFEKHIGINNVLGVCIHDHCLFPTTITKLQAKSNVASIDQQIIQSFTTLEDGFIKKFDQCVKAKQQSQIQTCYQELDIKIGDFLSLNSFQSLNPTPTQISKSILMYTETGTGKLIIKAKVEYSLSGNQFTKESNPIQTTLLFPKVKQSGKSSISLVNRTEIIGVKTTASQGTILLLSNPSGNYNLISWIDPLDQKLYPLFQEK